MKVNIKWGKETFKDVDVDTNEAPSQLKMQLYSLSGVPVERQKVMGKGGMLQDDSWGKVKVTEGCALTMIGTAEALPKAADEEVKFIEDLPEEEQERAETKEYGAGLVNLGNTCYMNSCLQCLRAAPELVSALESVPANAANASLAVAGQRLFEQMARGGTVTPSVFIAALRAVAPQFDQMGESKMKDVPGMPPGFGRTHAQQDAEECWQAMLNSWRGTLRQGDKDPISDLFGVPTRAELKCEESGEIATVDSFALNVKCNINQEVNHLGDGIKLGMQTDREQQSEALGRQAAFQGEAKIMKLPQYLTVHMMRFFYKVATQARAKIMRSVAFPLQLDVYDRCSSELQAELRPVRRAYRAIEDARLGVAPSTTVGASGSAAAADAGADTDADGDETMGADSTRDHTGAQTGRFDLIAVLTHKGRTLDSGHYIGWVKQGPDSWIQFDDDKLVPRKDEDITALSGGGDWHGAYMLLYRAQTVPDAAGLKSEKPDAEGGGRAAAEVDKPAMGVPPQAT